jgi:hypothetical protein
MTHALHRFTTLALAAALSALACDAGGGDADADTELWPVTFTFRFVSDIPESVWVDSTFNQSLVVVTRDGTELGLGNACGCACDRCPACPQCDAPCPSVTEVPAGGTATYDWSGAEAVQRSCPASPASRCTEMVSAPAGDYVVRFCWGTGFEADDCGDVLTSVECAEVPFTLPDDDGVVEYTLDSGG